MLCIYRFKQKFEIKMSPVKLIVELNRTLFNPIVPYSDFKKNFF